MKKPYAVLGCGPSGLLAAHALATSGREFTIISAKRKSVLGGAQFSHMSIPALTDTEPEALLTYRVTGEAEVYRDKVYGSSVVPFVSFDGVYDGMQVPAWSLRGMYDDLWDMYHGRILNVHVTHDAVASIGFAFNVISSVPLNAICAGQHSFRAQTVLIANELTGAGPQTPNTIWYDGSKEHEFYRQSMIFETGSTEWGASAAIPAGVQVKQVRKPIATDCTCHPDVIKVGRYGRWTKGVLTHHGYQDLTALMDAGELE